MYLSASSSRARSSCMTPSLRAASARAFSLAASARRAACAASAVDLRSWATCARHSCGVHRRASSSTYQQLIFDWQEAHLLQGLNDFFQPLYGLTGSTCATNVGSSALAVVP